MKLLGIYFCIFYWKNALFCASDTSFSHFYPSTMVKNSVKTHVSFPESLKTYTRILGVNAVVFSEFAPKTPLQNSREIQLLVFLFKISKF